MNMSTKRVTFALLFLVLGAFGLFYGATLLGHGEEGTSVEEGVTLPEPTSLLPSAGADETTPPPMKPPTQPVTLPEGGVGIEGTPPAERPIEPPEFWKDYPVREALERGEVVTQIEQDGDQRDTRAEGLVKASAATTWATLTDYEHYPDFMPDTVVCRVDAVDGLEYTVHQEVEVAWKTIRYDLAITHRDDGLGTTWHQTSGDLAVLEGDWTIVPLSADTCLIIYRLRVVPSFWVPESIANRMTRRSLPGVVKAIRERAEKS